MPCFYQPYLLPYTIFVLMIFQVHYLFDQQNCLSNFTLRMEGSNGKSMSKLESNSKCRQDILRQSQSVYRLKHKFCMGHHKERQTDKQKERMYQRGGGSLRARINTYTYKILVLQYLHFSSSVMSPQSSQPSHTHDFKIHLLFLQVNLPSPQGGYAA